MIQSQIELAQRQPPDVNCKHQVEGIARTERRATQPNLTAEDFDWLRKLQGATDAKRDPPPVPGEVAGKLRRFGFVAPNGFGGLAITDRGRGALLEQDMRDAEDR